MWYRLNLSALDAGQKPLLLDQTIEQGRDLVDLASLLGTQFHFLTERLRGTDIPFLEGVGYLTVEVQKWASLSSYERLAEEEGARLRAMRAYVMDALYFGPGSPKIATRTTPRGSSRN